MDKISLWLADIGLARYATVFEAEEIDLAVLRQMTDADLRELGLPMGPRKKVLAALAAMADQERAAPEDPVERAPQWRQVSVFFCDLVGSSVIADRIGAEAMRDLVAAYRRKISGVITGHGGWVAEFPGDGVVAYFGFPHAHEDDAARAVHAALRALQEIAELDAQWRARTGRAVEIRVAIDSGKVVIASPGNDPASPRNDITGEAPIVAARLQDLATAGEVLVSHRTRALCKGLFRFEARGETRLRNVSRPVEVFRVLDATGKLTPFQGSASYTPFVNREREIDLILKIWQRVAAGSGDIVVTSGEAGIGKSRLLNRIKEHLSKDRHGWVDLQCAPLVQQTAFFPVRFGLRSALRLGGGLEREHQIRRVSAIVRRLLGATQEFDAIRDLLLTFLGLKAPVTEAAEDITAGQRKRQTQRALVTLAVAVSRRRPLVICFDDVQWLDPTSREFLELLFEEISSSRILLFITFRPDFDPNWQAAPSIVQLKLGRLRAADSEVIVRSLSTGHNLPEPVQSRIIERCGGVPLYLEELTKSVGESAHHLEAGQLDSETRYAIPASLQQSISARLDRLAPVKEVAEIASVLGRTFDRRILEALSEIKGDELKTALRQLETGGVIYPAGDISGNEYQFKHALVRDAVYESMLSSSRRKVHAAAADALRAVRGEAVARNPEFVAFHLEAAENWSAATEAWLEAGVLAMDRSETSEAIEHLTRGIGLIARVATGDEALRTEVRLRTSLASALRATKGYAADEVSDHLTRARTICETLGDHDLMIEVLEGDQSFHHVRGELDRACELGRKLLGYASDQRGDSEASLRAIRTIDAHRRLGWTLLWMGEVSEAQRQFLKGLDIYETIAGDHRQLIRVYGDHPGIFTHCNLAWGYWYLGDVDASEAHVATATRLVDEADHLLSWTYAKAVFSTLHVMQLKPEQALEVSDATLASASRTWLPYWIAWARIHRGWARSQLDDPDGGAAEIKAGMEGYRATGAKLILPIAAGLLADAYHAGGHIAEAYRSTVHGLRLSRDMGILFYEPELLRRMGELQAQYGRKSDRADATLAQAIEAAAGRDAYFFELRARVSAIEARRGRGVSAAHLDGLDALVSRSGTSKPNDDLARATGLLDELRTRV